MTNRTLRDIVAIAVIALLSACSQKVADDLAKDAVKDAPATATASSVADSAAKEDPAGAAESTGSAVAARIVFIDRTTVLQNSAAGKHMAKQTEELAMQMEQDFKPENMKLQADVAALQSSAAVMAPDERQAKVVDLESRRQAFQDKVQKRQEAIQAGQAAARADMERALGPILEEIMAERGANLLLDRGLVVLGDPNADITADVVKRLDEAMPSAPITLTTQ